MANIFIDLHHSGLAYSFYLTLEKRLGHKIYFPIGMEWEQSGYWLLHKPYNYNKDTARQYLDLRDCYIPSDGTPPLTTIDKKLSTHFEIKDLAHNYIRKHLTLEQFKQMDIDIIIASIPDHAHSFSKLLLECKPKAKLVFQMGNMFNEVYDLIKLEVIKNLLASTVKFNTPNKINVCFYHQEIDTDIFKPIEPQKSNIISSFVIGLPKEQEFLNYKNALQQFDFRAYASKYYPFISTISELASLMVKSRFGYHVKPRGDGFGHIIYNWAYIGRPIITHFCDYKDKLAGELLEDNITAIDLDNGTIEENSKRIASITDNQYFKMISNINNRISSIIDYKMDAININNFFNNLI